MNAEELEALPPLTVVIDCDGDAWQRNRGVEGPWTCACIPEGETSAFLASQYPHIVLTPATDSGAERLAALRKAMS